MFNPKLSAGIFFPLLVMLCFSFATATTVKAVELKPKVIKITNGKIIMTVAYGDKACVTGLIINDQKVISDQNGAFTTIVLKDTTYSSLHLNGKPLLRKNKNSIEIRGIRYGGKELAIRENWIFTITAKNIKWKIERSINKKAEVSETALPEFNFDSINTWEGAYQGYGGLAWFYLFNEKLCTYGVHSRSSDFWNSKTGNGLNITVDGSGKNVAMKYSRTQDDKLAYSVNIADRELTPKLDSGTNRRRFLRGRTDVWAPFKMQAGKSEASITLSYFDFNKKYGRGLFKGINGARVGNVLNTIARIGVIDSLHFGGNSWHTPYGPICLHEQYIAQLGLAINDPQYLKGDESSLDFYRDHAIKPDGRVYSRWAYTNEDAAPGQFNKDGFYEAQWGTLMDSNPDLVTNIAELYDMTGDKQWVKRHQASCEKVLDWILRRDSNGNGLVEMLNDNHEEQKSSDWIDIVWASYENAFVNAKLYHALVLWASIERQLGNGPKAGYYAEFAGKLKQSFNKPTQEGGFWDEEKGCYDYWRDKNQSMHGRNMVTPVNFMAIAYGICDNPSRSKIILDLIELQMQREKLFFWPLAMSSYAPGEAKQSQYPFPSYENGDLFLSWGAIAVEAYASYKPEIAVKYIKNVLEQHSKDGLAFQRYGRLKQDGLGDDILSGNSLAIVGLYQAIYGINPLYNRFYLNPHMTAELSGTELNYRFRGALLKVRLEENRYAVSGAKFKVISGQAFGFNESQRELAYFHGSNSEPSLELKSKTGCTLDIHDWSPDKMEWEQILNQFSPQSLKYTIHRLKPNSAYLFSVNGKLIRNIKSDLNGDLEVNHHPGAVQETLRLNPGN